MQIHDIVTAVLLVGEGVGWNLSDKLVHDLILLLSVQVKEFLERFDSIPDMLELDHLTVSGDVTFGKGVSLKVHCCAV